MSETITVTTFRTPVPDDVAAQYDSVAGRLGKPIEEVLSRQLSRFAPYVESTKPIVVPDEDRQKLEQLLGKNISDSSQLVRLVVHMVSVGVNGVEIELTPYLLDRLKSRCYGMEFDKFLSMTIRRALEEYAGLR